MPVPDVHKNFAYSIVAGAPSPASSGTSLSVSSGGGVKFPAVPFNATVWPSGQQALDFNAEIVRVTNISGDTLTMTRAQEGSNPRSILVGDQISATITQKTLVEAEGMTGEMRMWAALAAPRAWLACDGASYLRATYPDLSALLITSLSTFTVTLASPAVFTTPGNHGLSVNDRVMFTTTGALPTGLSANTTYYVIATGLTATQFQVSATPYDHTPSTTATGGPPFQNYLPLGYGAAVNTSVSQNGVHTVWRCPYGVADATHFNVPDLRGRVPVGFMAGGPPDVAIGANDGVAAGARNVVHHHLYTGVFTVASTGTGGQSAPGNLGAETSGERGTANFDTPAYQAVNFIIRT